MADGREVTITGNGSPITSVEEWFEHAPPTRRGEHWQDGKSAKELAKAWFRTGAAAMPSELDELFRSSPLTAEFEVQHVRAEHVTTFDAFGTGRHHDLLLELVHDQARLIVGIEAKVAERLDTPVAAKHALGRKKREREESTKLPERIDGLTRALFGSELSTDQNLGNLRYQLLTAAAGTLVEADLAGADAALLIVHDLASDPTNSLDDVSAFVSKLDASIKRVELGALYGPFNVPGEDRIPASLPLYVAVIAAH